MRVKEVDPDKERFRFGGATPLFKPRQEASGSLGSPSLPDHKHRGSVFGPEVIVIAVKPLGEIITPVQDQGRDKGLCRIARGLQPLRQSHGVVSQGIGTVVTYPMG